MPQRLSPEEIEEALIGLPEWELQGNKIIRTLIYQNFLQAIESVNAIAQLAEADHHHPDIDIRFNKVRLALSTHSKGGLTALDFQLAEKINALDGF